MENFLLLALIFLSSFFMMLSFVLSILYLVFNERLSGWYKKNKNQWFLRSDPSKYLFLKDKYKTFCYVIGSVCLAFALANLYIVITLVSMM